MTQKPDLYSGTVSRIDSKEVNYTAEIYFDEFMRGIVSIYRVSREDMRFLRECATGTIVLKLQDEKFLTIFNYYTKCGTSTLSKLDIGENEDCLFDVVIISSAIIKGEQDFCLDKLIHKIRFTITCGHELFGECPYDINSEFERVLTHESLNVPMQCKQIVASTDIGNFEFVTMPKYWASSNSFSIGFSHYILFETREEMKVEDIRCHLEKMTDFFSILCGEQITINKIDIIEDIEDKLVTYEYIGYCNYPKQQLRILDNSGIDTTGYKRRAIFKLTDFTDLQTTFNYWLAHYEALNNAQMAYERILLDEDVKVYTINKFLAAMQLVEGYSQAYIDEKEKKKEFDKQKESILKQLPNEEDKSFVKNALMMPGITFRNALIDFMWKGLFIFDNLSKEEFSSRYEKDLVDKIVKDRNYYTHSSKRITPHFSFEQLMDISVVVKIFYRCLLLKSFGMSDKMICNRFFHDRMAMTILKEIFNIQIQWDEQFQSKFDNEMWLFSDPKSNLDA